MGLFVDGRFDPNGAWHADGYTFSCARGVVAKCVDMQPLHRACVRAARAEYCGDGVSYTEDGTLIDMFDIYGLNVRESPAGFAEESKWSDQRANSLNHPRINGLVPVCRVPGISSAGEDRPASTDEELVLIHVWSSPASLSEPSSSSF